MSTIKANAILDSAGGNTATINGITPALASQAEAQAGTNNTKLMTPLRVEEAILASFNVTGTAPTYACRAWVKFVGTGTVAISASGNVSSITDNGTGDYTINFTTAMPDANYATVVSGGGVGDDVVGSIPKTGTTPTTSAINIVLRRAGSVVDIPTVNAAVFR